MFNMLLLPYSERPYGPPRTVLLTSPLWCPATGVSSAPNSRRGFPALSFSGTGRNVIAKRTGTADLPLHGGKAPAWLFGRMRDLSREITLVIASEYGPDEMLRRLSDPVWFQAFGAVLGFDWHSSGVTTTVCGALKEGLRGLSHETGLLVAGGKGATSRKTPGEIEASEKLLSVQAADLVKASRMSAKVDSAALQDGFQLYHHTFVYTTDGRWAVVQQGMDEHTKRARRYHWLSEGLRDFVEEPHAAVVSQGPAGGVLNMVHADSKPARHVVTELSQRPGEELTGQLNRLKELSMPGRHDVRLDDIHPRNLHKIFLSTYERQPQDFETLLGLPGVGAKTIRALSLIAELVYDTPASRCDPVLFSYAHGGKDGFPYPVDRDLYDRNLQTLRTALAQARLGRTERLEAFKRLSRLEHEAEAPHSLPSSAAVSEERQ